jgi:Arm DNA-binding domain
MLTEFALRGPKPRTAPYKIADRDGMYAAVSPAGTISFRYDYRINGRRETLTIDRYGRGGIWLALVREKLLDARRAVREGKSPAMEKQRQKQRRALTKTFGEWAASWLDGARTVDTTRSVRKGIVARDVLPAFNGRLLCEVTADLAPHFADDGAQE